MKFLLVDGYNLAYRCFFAIPELTRADGFPTNALHGWVKSLWRLADQEKPDGTVVFFDLGGSQDRLALHAEYKAHRADMPEPLALQMPVIRELTRAMGLAGVEQDGVESDDLLASHAWSLAARGDQVLVVSSDKDFAQIVGERIKIMLPPPTANPKLGWRVMDAAGVADRKTVWPAIRNATGGSEPPVARARCTAGRSSMRSSQGLSAARSRAGLPKPRVQRQSTKAYGSSTLKALPSSHGPPLRTSSAPS